MTVPESARPLAGVRIVEISSFVAVPLAGMTLTQLGGSLVAVLLLAWIARWLRLGESKITDATTAAELTLAHVNGFERAIRALL